MADEFALRFPFRPLRWVTGLEQPAIWEADGRRFTLSDSKPYLVLQIEPFASEEAAAAFLPRAWEAVAWMAVRAGTGFLAEMELDSIVFSEDPEKAGENLRSQFGIPKEGPVHGLVNGNFPAVLPIGKVIKFVTANDATFIVTDPAGRILPLLQEGLQSTGATLYEHERFRTALELFCDEAREGSLRSRFLTLVMALEVLAVPTGKHPIAQRLLDDLERQVLVAMEKHDEGSDEREALESLQRELLFRRQTSLRSRVRQLVLDGLPDLAKEARRERAREVAWAYDLRGKLVHEGRVEKTDLTRAHEIARREVRALLSARLRRNGVGVLASPAT